MSRIYYEIQMTARQLTVVLVLLVLALVGAFLLGYGAGTSTAGAPENHPPRSPSVIAESIVTPPPEVTPSVSRAGAAPAERPTATPRPTATATPEPTATHRPAPTSTPVRRRATPHPTVPARPMVPRREGFWVQVLAARHPEAIAKARERLVQLDFPKNHHWVLQTPTAEGTVLYKLRIGPFPDRASAERVARRMQDAEFPDAWVVAP